MRKNGFLALLCILALMLCACAKYSSGKYDLPTETTELTEPAAVEIPFAYQHFIMEIWLSPGDKSVEAVIRSHEELQSFCEEKSGQLWLADAQLSTPRLSEICASYGEEFFEDKYLILLAFCGGSYASEMEKPEIVYNLDGRMAISIDCVDEWGFGDGPGSWCCVLEISKEYPVAAGDIDLDIQEHYYQYGRPTES